MVIDDKRLVEIAARVQAPELDPVSKARMRAALLSTIEGVSPKPAAEAASP